MVNLACVQYQQIDEEIKKKKNKYEVEKEVKSLRVL